MKVLLDTCTFLWVAGEPGRLSPEARDMFRDPGNEVFLSAASVWEISVKYGLGRLPLPEPPSRYLPDLRERHGVLSLPIDEEAASQVAALPHPHRDPFDRMLVCQALVGGMVILTPDPLIAEYPVRTRW